MSININFTEQDWERIKLDWTVWWEGELDRPMVILETVNTMFAGKEVFTREFMLEKPVDEVLDIYQQTANKRRKYLLTALGDERAAAMTNRLVKEKGS